MQEKQKATSNNVASKDSFYLNNLLRNNNRKYTSMLTNILTTTINTIHSTLKI